MDNYKRSCHAELDRFLRLLPGYGKDPNRWAIEHAKAIERDQHRTQQVEEVKQRNLRGSFEGDRHRTRRKEEVKTRKVRESTLDSSYSHNIRGFTMDYGRKERKHCASNETRHRGLTYIYVGNHNSHLKNGKGVEDKEGCVKDPCHDVRVVGIPKIIAEKLSERRHSLARIYIYIYIIINILHYFKWV